MEPFRRRDIYHWRMNGSYSPKSVLPVLVPEMTYDGMEISDGAMASEAYFALTAPHPAPYLLCCLSLGSDHGTRRDKRRKER